MMNSREIRKQFLKFFEDKSHEIVSSAPMVIKDDPTLMFTNAGMNQFKEYFLGNKVPKNQRATDTQKWKRYLPPYYVRNVGELEFWRLF